MSLFQNLQVKTVKLDTLAFYRLDIIITEGQRGALKSVSLGKNIELFACIYLINQRGEFEVNLGRSPLLHINSPCQRILELGQV